MAEKRASVSVSVTNILKSMFTKPRLTLKAAGKYTRLKSRCNL